LWPDLSVLSAAPGLRPLFALAATAFFALACLEGTFGRLLAHRFGYGPREFGLIFGYESLLSVLVQTLLLAWLAARVRAPRLLAVAYGLQGVGLALTPFAPGLSSLFALSTLYAVGVGVATPTLNGLCSAGTPPARQGEMFGLLQGARSAGFLIGPTLGSVLFDWRVEVPYLLAGAVLVLGGGVWAIVTERHTAHEHRHEHTHEHRHDPSLVHTHRHVHDAHHRHRHR
jgi:predicted MFS family arabinose efflux permease